MRVRIRNFYIFWLYPPYTPKLISCSNCSTFKFIDVFAYVLVGTSALYVLLLQWRLGAPAPLKYCGRKHILCTAQIKLQKCPNHTKLNNFKIKIIYYFLQLAIRDADSGGKTSKRKSLFVPQTDFYKSLALEWFLCLFLNCVFNFIQIL